MQPFPHFTVRVITYPSWHCPGPNKSTMIPFAFTLSIYLHNKSREICAPIALNCVVRARSFLYILLINYNQLTPAITLHHWYHHQLVYSTSDPSGNQWPHTAIVIKCWPSPDHPSQKGKQMSRYHVPCHLVVFHDAIIWMRCFSTVELL